MLKILKQELLFIPIMLIIIEVFRSVVVHYWPETALFDRGSELETFIFRLWQIVWITASCWLLIAVVFPPGFKVLKKLYENFDNYDHDFQVGLSLKLWCVFFFGLVLLLSASGQTPVRYKLCDTLESQLHVRELTGRNDGADVERYLAFVGQKKGAPWCAAFVSWALDAAGVSTPPNPKTAWSPSFANPKYQVWSRKNHKGNKDKTIQPGDVFTLFYSHLGRVGHTGFIVGHTGNYWITIEGNTAGGGSREGHGVYKLKRAKSKIYAITNYIDKRS